MMREYHLPSVTDPRPRVSSQQEETFAGNAPRGDQPSPQGGGFFYYSSGGCTCFNSTTAVVRQPAFPGRHLERNPFEELKGAVQGNREKFRFVTLAETEQILAACPDHDWRLLIALSRFGGVRTPSESLSLKWQDIDWEKGRVLITSPKTEHHEGKGERWIPLFPELRPDLQECWDRAPEGAVAVIQRYQVDVQKTSTGWKNCNLRTQFTKIIRRAGLSTWPKPFHNLRASRQTELSASFPLHVVCEWLGNSQLIAQEHYLRVVDSDFERAIDPVSALQNPVQYSAVYSGLGSQTKTSENAKTPEIPGFADACSVMPEGSMGDTGFEPVTSTV